MVGGSRAVKWHGSLISSIINPIWDILLHASMRTSRSCSGWTMLPPLSSSLDPPAGQTFLSIIVMITQPAQAHFQYYLSILLHGAAPLPAKVS
jgi:hypothetical protein